jgi:hypothetical protein
MEKVFEDLYMLHVLYNVQYSLRFHTNNDGRVSGEYVIKYAHGESKRIFIDVSSLAVVLKNIVDNAKSILTTHGERELGLPY